MAEDTNRQKEHPLTSRASRRDAIMDAAIQAFGERGLDRASVDEIARTAGVAKGTVYLYFRSKEEIFDAILAERWPGPFLDSVMPRLLRSPQITGAPLGEVLGRIGNGFLYAVEENMLILRLAVAEAYRFPERAEHLFESTFLKANRLLADFLAARAESGEIRSLDSPLIVARCFQGTLMTYVLSQELLGGKHFTPIRREDWVREAVRLFLEGVRLA